MPEQYKALVEPQIPNIIHGIYQAYSVSVGSIFQIGMYTTIAALVAALVMRELPLRTTMGHGPSATRDPKTAGQPAGVGAMSASAPAPD